MFFFNFQVRVGDNRGERGRAEHERENDNKSRRASCWRAAAERVSRLSRGRSSRAA